MTRIRVLLVDDHAVVRMGFKLLLQTTRDIEIAGEAESGEEACRLHAELRPDVLVMDLSMRCGGSRRTIRGPGSWRFRRTRTPAIRSACSRPAHSAISASAARLKP
jgi:CheY-like chemotaxis protein